MSKTHFSNKCAVLGELWMNYHDAPIFDEEWITFFRWADVGLPLSYMVWQDLVSLKRDGDGRDLIEATWQVFCEALSIDPDAEYMYLDDCLDASPNPDLPIMNGAIG